MSIEAGIGGCPFRLPLDKLTYLTECTWIANTIRSCQKYGTEITTSLHGIKKWTDRDEYIMSKALDTLSPKELQLFNKVRMYLKVATTSNLAKADGKSIDKHILFGKRGGSPSPSTFAYQWPNIPEPSRAERRIWTICLCKVYGVTESNPTLEYNNYRWFNYESIQHTAWNIDLLSGSVIAKEKDSSWQIWNPLIRESTGTRRTSLYSKSPTTITNMDQSTHWRPVSIDRIGDNITVTSRGRYHASVDTDVGNTDECWYLPEAPTISDSASRKFLTNIQNNDGLIVTDGSYKEGKSTAAFIVQHEAADEPSIGNSNSQRVTVPGHPMEQNSYRGELGGILASISYTNSILSASTPIHGQCTLGCDNIGALQTSFGWNNPTPDWACYDILSLIRESIKKSPIKWMPLHIKGHQDDERKRSSVNFP